MLIAGTAGGSSTGDLIEGNLIGVLADSTASGNGAGGINLAFTSGVAVSGNTIENNLASGIVASNSIGTTIGGSAAGAANIITANRGFGIELLEGESVKIDTSSSLSTGDLIQDNLIGVLADGTATGNLSTGIYAIDTSGLLILGNTVEASGHYGIATDAAVSSNGIEIDASTGTTIGGSAAGAGNIIGGNAADGVLLQGTPKVPSTGDLIEGNLIGVLANSTASGNGQDGILAQGTSGLAIFGNTAENNDAGIVVLNSIGTTVGGTAIGAANVISDNLHPGLVLHQDKDLAVIGNTIESNGSSGITGGAFSGSSALFADNIIKSNAGAGIFVGGSSVTIEVQGNDIESNQTGGVAISVSRSSSSSSSFAANIVGNTIKTNTGDGIFVTGGAVTLTIQGNEVDGNTAAGIAVNEPNATIGGTGTGAGNTIATNGGAGINLGLSSSSGVRHGRAEHNQGKHGRGSRDKHIKEHHRRND